MNDVHRARLLALHRIELIVDVGANAGQYSIARRNHDYQGAIVSFEPTSAAFARLCTVVDKDPNWSAHNLALGDAVGTISINLAANSYSSSVLEVMPAHVDAAPDAAYCGQEEAELRTLDSLPPAWFAPGARMLKIDTQGYEPAVLRGAKEFLQTVELVEIEMSIIPIYAGQDLAHEVIFQMRENRFVPVSLEASFSHPVTGEIQCIDAIFARVHDRDLAGSSGPSNAR